MGSGKRDRAQKSWPIEAPTSTFAGMRMGNIDRRTETKTACCAVCGAADARTLSTTNPIEFLNGRIRRTTHNVAKWDGGEMVMRWLAVALIEASKTFRKLRGYKGMPKLVAALRAHDKKLKPAIVDATERAA